MRARQVDQKIGAGAVLRNQGHRADPIFERARHPLDLVGREAAAVQTHQQQRRDVFLLLRLVRAAEPGGAGFAMPAAGAGEFVQLVDFPPLRGYPVPVAKQPELAVESLVVGKPQQNPGQDRLPLLVFASAVPALDRRFVRRDERLDQVEHRMPEPCLDAARALIIRRVLLGQIADDGLEPRIDAQQRLGLRRADRAAAAGKRGDEVERLVLQLQRVGGGQASRSSAPPRPDCAMDRDSDLLQIAIRSPTLRLANWAPAGPRPPSASMAASATSHRADRRTGH